jgi:hypothetical protein
VEETELIGHSPLPPLDAGAIDTVAQRALEIEGRPQNFFSH